MAKEVSIFEYLTTKLSDTLPDSKNGEPEIEFEVRKPIDPWPEITKKLNKKEK